MALAPADTNGHGRLRKFAQVGGDIERQLRAAVHAPDAAGGEDVDAARCAAIIVAATVVAPVRLVARATARSAGKVS